MSNPKTPRKGRVHSFGDALDAKVERASKALGFAPTSDSSASAPIINVEAGEQLLWIDVDAIDDNPFQPRTDYPNDAQLDLIRTINEDGQLMPIGVRPHPGGVKGRYQARFGHRRKHAVGTGALYTDDTGEERRVYANAGVKQPKPSSYVGQIWCVVRETNDAEMRREAWQENAARLALPIMDQARFFVGTREALGQGGKPASWQKTAEFLGEKDRVYVYRVGALLDLPEAMRAALEVGPNGEKPLLNERHGRALLMLQGSDDAESHQKAQRELFREIKKQLLSGAEAERRAKERRQFLAQKTPSEEDNRLFQMQKDEKIAEAKSEPSAPPSLRSVPSSETPQPASAPNVPPQDQTEDGERESVPVNGEIARIGEMIEAAQKTIQWAGGELDKQSDIPTLAYEGLIEFLRRLERDSRRVRGHLEERLEAVKSEIEDNS